jgi:hypothetical protein
MAGQWRQLLQLLLRDGVVVAGVLGLWILLRHGALAHGFGHVALSVVVALLTTVLGYLAHEWGHLLGAIAAGATFQLPATPFESFFLFRFDRDRSSRPQFFAMALGGFAASILSVLLFVLLLPWGVLATWLALALVVAGVIATLVIEVPEFWGVWRGGPLPQGSAFVSQGPRRSGSSRLGASRR